MTTITADYRELLLQADITVQGYFKDAVAMIDDAFGEGSAVKHPQLIAALVQAQTVDFATASFGKVVGELVDVIREKDFGND